MIKTITADDADQEPITFSLVTTGVPFELNPTTGDLKITQELDRETTSSYVLTVNANDGQASVGITFTITVTDENDNAPEFSEPIYRIELPENTNIDQVVFTVLATDKDIGSNQEMMFVIKSGNDDETFEIDEV